MANEGKTTELDFINSLALMQSRGKLTFVQIDNELRDRYTTGTPEQRVELKKALGDFQRNAERIAQSMAAFSSVDAFEQNRS